MAAVCRVCDGTGSLLTDVCPLCDGKVYFRDEEQQCFVFLLAGQSNMVGRGTGPEIEQPLMDFIQHHADVHMAYDIDRKGIEQPTANSGRRFLPLARQTQWSEGGQCYTHGPEWGIAQRIVERLIVATQQSGGGAHAKKPRIYFIKFAMGSTNLHEDWSLARPYYREFIAFSIDMLQQVAELEGAPRNVDCMFWNQGDSDASGRLEMREKYHANLINFVQRVWADLAPVTLLFPFVPLQLHWKVDETSKSTRKYRKDMGVVNEAIRSACRDLGMRARMANISPEFEAQLTAMSHDDGHSGSAGLVLEGCHLADTFINLITEA